MAKIRVLRTKLQKYLSVGERQQVGFTAKSIGIAPNTLRTLLRDDWDQLARDSIERVCDRFQLDIGDLFEFAPDGFWSPFEKAGQYTILAGTASGNSLRDTRTAATLAMFLQSVLLEVDVVTKASPSEPDEIVDYVRKHNCIVVGSPLSNRATEVVLSRHFGAQPFETGLKNRAKIPVRFVFKKRGRQAKNYAMIEPWSAGRGDASGLGICNQDGTQMIVEVDWWSKAEYLRRPIRRGRDCGLLCVINKPFRTSRDVKTIVLAGFSQTGTQGAARALARDFRSLEPLGSARHVLGIVEAVYKKLPNQDSRSLVGIHWKYLTGGRKRRLLQTPSKVGAAGL